MGKLKKRPKVLTLIDENIANKYSASEEIAKFETRIKDSNIDERHQNPTKNSKAEGQPLVDEVSERILHKYKKLKGKQLYIRFPQKLPLDEAEFQKKAKALSPLIIKAHKPRQKHARFCLVDFSTKEDRDKCLKKITSLIKEEDKAYKGIYVSIPKTESADFVNELIIRKQKSIENKRAKAKFKRASKKSTQLRNYTSSIIVTNLPKTLSTGELRKLFPNAVDIHYKYETGKNKDTSIAIITLPTAQDAQAAIKQELFLNDVKLILRFNTGLQSYKKKLRNKRNKTLM